MNPPIAVSWSTGKDSAFALWTLLNEGDFQPLVLLTTVTEGYDRVSMHGVRERLLDEQTSSVGLPLVKIRIPPNCPNEIYEERMAAALAEPPLDGIRHIAFADLFLEDIRAYREDRLARVGKEGVFPLWARDTAALGHEMIASGFRARLVCVDPRALDQSFAGRPYDEDLLASLPDAVDPCGERGEFHTFVHDGPIFREPVACRTGEVVTRDGFVFCDLAPVGVRT